MSNKIMQELSTFQLMEQLMKKSHEEVEYVILHLMLNRDKKNRIDSHRILDLYMRAIEIIVALVLIALFIGMIIFIFGYVFSMFIV